MHFFRMIILTVVFLVFFNPQSFASDIKKTKKVLILCSFHDIIPAYEILIPVIRSKLKAGVEYSIEFYSEYMDLTRFMDDLYLQQIRGQ